MEIAVHNQQGKDTGTKVSFEAAIVNQEPNNQAIYEAVRQHLANRRQGTAKTKERGEVKGTKKKPYRQKGTGNARAGDVKSPLWRHGGTIFGPRPRDYHFKLNKKVLRLARRSALAQKLNAEAVTVIDAFKADVPKTKEFIAMLNNLSLSEDKVLVITGTYDKVFYRSGRNLPNVRIVHAKQAITYDMVNADRILVTEEAVEILNSQLS